MKNVLIFLVIISSICFAQNNLTFPFNSGDKWIYDVYSAFTPFPIGKAPYQLGYDTLMPNNKSYKRFAVFYFRKDGPKVYQYSQKDSSEYLRYDLSKQKGDTVSYIKRGSDSSVIIVASDQSESVFGQSRRVISFHSKDGSVWDAIADSIGILGFSNVIDISYRIAGAVILGKSYGDVTSVKNENSSVPIEPKLSQNYPNPFNPVTTIHFDIPKSTKVKITITNELGQHIATMVDSYKQIGSYDVKWNASNYSSGIYICTMRCDNFVKSMKLVLQK